LTAAALIQPSRTRPGRPSKAQSAAIDARILDAAWAVFGESGFDAATMEAIAERAGVTRMTLYQRHTDKLSLFRAVITGRNDSWSKVSERTSWMVGDTLEARLSHFARTAIEWSQNPEIDATRRMSEGARNDAGKVATELEMLFREKMAAMLAADIADYAGREGITLHDAHEIARFFIGLLESVIREAGRSGNDMAMLKKQSERAVAILLCGKDAW
jgi:TetR/AcrR family transcriptional regulator, mexJK operon transcriptional repressor